MCVGRESLCFPSVQPCFIITRRQCIWNLSAPPAGSFFFPPFLYECILIHNSAVFYDSGAFLSNVTPTPYLIYWGGERYKGTAYKITSWWPLLLTRLLALWSYLFFKWLIYWHLPSSTITYSVCLSILHQLGSIKERVYSIWRHLALHLQIATNYIPAANSLFYKTGVTSHECKPKWHCGMF